MKNEYSNSSLQGYFDQLDKNFKEKHKLKIELINVFLDQIPKALSKMEAGLDEEGLSSFGFEAHRIKSTIRIIGLPKLQPIILKMDDYCYNKINTEQIPSLFKEFKEQAKIDVQILLKEKERLSAFN